MSLLIIFVLGVIFNSRSSTRLGSISIAKNFFTIFDKGKVRAPLPGPISKIISFFSGLNSVMILLMRLNQLYIRELS